MRGTSRMPPLKDVCRTAFVIAHTEDTGLLEATLKQEGFDTTVLRGPYTERQLTFAAAARCLINHAHAWKAVARMQECAIVVEADFVPVRGFGALPAPAPAPAEPGAGFAWLYSAGSILYGFDAGGHPHGHGNTTVAYLLSPKVATLLLTFYEREAARNEQGSYTQWETYLGIFLRKEHGVLNFIPTYQYGEHGGLPSHEHSDKGVRAWHQADVLMGPLAFPPAYARASRMRYLAIRARAVCRGWARLLLLRFYDPRYINRDTSRGRGAMAWFSIARLLHLVGKE